MVLLFHTVAALFLLLVDSVSSQKYELNIRDNGKICTQWIKPVGGQFSLSYSPQQECTSGISVEQANGQARLCCQGMPVTTPSTNFSRECGKQAYQPLKQRIIGGLQARPNSWPWQIMLHGASNLCGGALIDARHVLTAAHCITTPVQEKDYKVYIGTHETNKPMYMEQELTVSKIWVHEQYVETTTANDVAVIRLTKPIQISDKVNVICLPGPEAKSVNDTVWVSGWGRTAHNGDVSTILKQTYMETMGNRCSSIYGTAHFSQEKQICAGKHGVGYTCQGDSGGPLMYEYEGRWYLNGVVSYGATDCGVGSGSPAVFARVKYYLPWIRSKMASA
jgi:secreted trypsin-like serine protease